MLFFCKSQEIFSLDTEIVDIGSIGDDFVSGSISIDERSLQEFSLFTGMTKLEITDSLDDKMVPSSAYVVGVAFITSETEEGTKCRSIKRDNLSNSEPIRMECCKDEEFSLKQFILNSVFAENKILSVRKHKRGTG